MLQKVFYSLACLALPVLWGVAVNWAFDFWQGRSGGAESERGDDEDPNVLDYQI